MYNQQVEALIDYFKKAEKKTTDFLLGIEVEHLVVQKNTLQAVSFSGKNGIESVLNQLLKSGWSGEYEEENLLGLKKGELSISLEPGGQLEVSIAPEKEVAVIKKHYLSFLKELLPILQKKNLLLMNIGYQPVSKISDISLLPKKRYYYMYDYFKKRGKYAHNMMKGTAAVHVNFDFSSEEDFIKKYRLSSFLSPVIYVIFDNAPVFEGRKYDGPSIRAKIWEDCDQERCGNHDIIFKKGFGYSSYAEFLLNTPSLLIKKDDELIFTGRKKLKKFFNPDNISRKELEYFLTLVFPEIRLKNCLEIRLADSIPFPLNIAYLVFWKGILYNEKVLNQLYDSISGLNCAEVKDIRQNIFQLGTQAKVGGQDIFDYFFWLLDLSAEGLSTCEQKYIVKLKEVFRDRLNFKEKILINLKEKQNLPTALNDNIVNNFYYQKEDQL